MIPDFLIPLLGILIPPIAKWLKANGWPKFVNEAIAAFIVLLVAFICTILTHSLSSNIIISLLAVAGVAAYLINGPLSALYQWLVIGKGIDEQNTVHTPATRQHKEF